MLRDKMNQEAIDRKELIKKRDNKQKQKLLRKYL